MKKMKSEIKSAFRLSVPVMAGYIFLGIAFGLLMKTNGYSAITPVIMSIIIYSGALEFAAVPVLAEPFNPAGAFILGFMLSIRHLFYGIPMLKKYSGTGKIKPFLIFGLTDETFSILSSTEAPENVRKKPFYVFVTLFNYFYWVSGTALGALFGNLIKFDLKGLDFALTALFIVLFIEQIRSKDGLISGFSGLIASVCVLLLCPKEYFVLISMAVILIILVSGRRVIVREC